MLRCPSCREEVAVPASGITGFPSNFIVQSIVDEMEDGEAAEEEVAPEVPPRLCDDCKEEGSEGKLHTAVFVCLKCLNVRVTSCF